MVKSNMQGGLTKWQLTFLQEGERRWRTRGEGIASSTATTCWWCAATGTMHLWAGAVQMQRRGDDRAAFSRAQWGERRSSETATAPGASKQRRHGGEQHGDDALVLEKRRWVVCASSDGGWCATTGTVRSWAGAVQMQRQGDDGAALNRAQWGERRSSGQTLERPNRGIATLAGRGGAEQTRPTGRMASTSMGECAGWSSWR
ncbi:hypothetical protein Taro_031377 [Colocasia esculenta]|uniref:Uncharacterized protein n=1 Tax=Colocasia esculenta TaxID=4460 RepID=A0A843VIQ7_COLES|nr:hypothetical protein [Colocasia esculenta]